VKDALALILWAFISVLFVLFGFGWEPAVGVALMIAFVGLADLLWAKLTGATVSEWFWRRKKQKEAGVVIFVLSLALGLILHLLGV